MTQHLPAAAHVTDFASIPANVRREIFALEELFKKAADSKSATQVLTEAATQFRRGWSFKSLDRKFRAWKNSGRSWTALIDRAKVKTKRLAVTGYESEDKTNLSKAFLDYWRQLVLENQRCDSAAYQKLCHQWRNGSEIPGYGTWRQWWMSSFGGQVPDICPGIPKSWSRRNLSRFSPPPIEKVAARIGRSSARSMAPLVFTTRCNLNVGQFYMFDDLWHDVKVNFVGVNTRAMRPLELACLDVFSGSKIAHGLTPIIENLAEDKKRMLTEKEMRFLLAHVLINIGFRKEGCFLIVEHGTASIPEWLEKLLFDISGGAIIVQRSGIDNAAAFAGAYLGRSKGNFRLKASLESQHNIAHSMLADIAGQTGPQERFGPEELHGRQRHNDALLQVMAALPPERAALLRFPLIHFQQFCQIVTEMYDLIDCRIQHDLEGYEEAGLVIPEFRLDASHPFVPMSTLDKLPPETRAGIEALMHIPGHSRIRKMSPREVFRRGSSGLVKLPESAACLILNDRIIGRKVEDNGLFVFKDRDLGSDYHRYLAVVQTAEGFRRRLRDGESYGTLVNPFNPSRMLVTDAAGAFIGVCPRWEKVDRSDMDSINQQMGKANHELNERIAPVAAAGRAKIRKRIEDAKHNTNVIAGAPITRDEHERAAAMKDFKPADLAAGIETDDEEFEAGPTFSANHLL